MLNDILRDEDIRGLRDYLFDEKNKSVALVAEKCTQLHDGVGSKYDGGGYYLHLDGVATIALKYGRELFTETQLREIIKSAYAHDTLEDCGISPHDLIKIVGSNDIRPLYGKGLCATIVYCVTDELGWNRKERISRTLCKTALLDEAQFIKLCDRLFNTMYSKASYESNPKNNMYKKYCSEFGNFEKVLRRGNLYNNIWEDLTIISE